jgi:hypothetical protein
MNSRTAERAVEQQEQQETYRLFFCCIPVYHSDVYLQRSHIYLQQVMIELNETTSKEDLLILLHEKSH